MSEVFRFEWFGNKIIHSTFVTFIHLAFYYAGGHCHYRCFASSRPSYPIAGFLELAERNTSAPARGVLRISPASDHVQSGKPSDSSRDSAQPSAGQSAELARQAQCPPPFAHRAGHGKRAATWASGPHGDVRSHGRRVRRTGPAGRLRGSTALSAPQSSFTLCGQLPQGRNAAAV